MAVQGLACVIAATAGTSPSTQRSARRPEAGGVGSSSSAGISPSVSQEPISWRSRCCRRCTSLRLESSTRCRPSFLRATTIAAAALQGAGQRSMSWAQAWAWAAGCPRTGRSGAGPGPTGPAAWPAAAPHAGPGRRRSAGTAAPAPCARGRQGRHGAAFFGPGLGVVLGRGLQLGHARRRSAALAIWAGVCSEVAFMSGRAGSAPCAGSAGRCRVGFSGLAQGQRLRSRRGAGHGHMLGHPAGRSAPGIGRLIR
jgi:hypothetical protein